MSESKKKNTTQPQTSQPKTPPKPKNPYLANGKFDFSNMTRFKDGVLMECLLIVSVNRLIYIKSLNDFRDFFYS